MERSVESVIGCGRRMRSAQSSSSVQRLQILTILAMMVGTSAAGGVVGTLPDYNKIGNELALRMDSAPPGTQIPVLIHLDGRPGVLNSDQTAFRIHPALPPVWSVAVSQIREMAAGRTLMVVEVANAIWTRLETREIAELSNEWWVKSLDYYWDTLQPRAHGDPWNDAVDNIVNLSPLYGQGFDGTGIVIGHVDSGITQNHPALSGGGFTQIEPWVGGPASNNGAQYDFCWDTDFIPNSGDSSETGNNVWVADDLVGHGTGTATLMVGRDPMLGPPPLTYEGFSSGATLAVAKIFCSPGEPNAQGEPGAPPGTLLMQEGIKWLVLEDFNNDGIVPDVDIIQSSVGASFHVSGPTCDTPIAGDGNDPLSAIASWVVNMGVPFVQAANDQLPPNPCPGITNPALGTPESSLDVISVGALDANAQGWLSNQVAAYSARGPTSDGRRGPDLVAPGGNSAAGCWCLLMGQVGGGYGRAAGTSFAAPIVSSIVAILLEKNPTWTPAQVYASLAVTADHAAGPDNTFGYGIPDANAASGYANHLAVSNTQNFGSSGLGDMAASSGKIHVVADGEYYRSPNGGTTWGWEYSLGNWETKIAAYGHKVYALWPDGGNLKFRFSPDGGSTWYDKQGGTQNGIQTIVSSGTVGGWSSGIGDPAITADASGVYIVFADSRGTMNEIFYTMSDDGGQTWCGQPTACGTTDVQISSGLGSSSVFPTITVDDFSGSSSNGIVVAGWHDYRDSHTDAGCQCWLITPQVYAVITGDYGDAWTTEFRLSGPGGGGVPDYKAMNPNIDLNNGIMAVVWEEERSDDVQMPTGATPPWTDDLGATNNKIVYGEWRFNALTSNFDLIVYQRRLSYHSTVTGSQSVFGVVATMPNSQATDVYVAYQNGWNNAWESPRLKKGVNAGIDWFPDQSWGTSPSENLVLRVDNTQGSVVHFLRISGNGIVYERIFDWTSGTL